MSRATELSHRADVKELAAFSGEPRMVTLLNADSPAADWRLVETFSLDGRPFELEAGWSAGSGSGAQARITVARATRVCVFARSLTLRTANLSNQANRVGITVADGFALTENCWEFLADCGEEAVVTLPIPPFARKVSLHLPEPGLLETSWMTFYDGQLRPTTRIQAAQLPDDGLRVGGAARIEVSTQPGTTVRAVFTLAL